MEEFEVVSDWGVVVGRFQIDELHEGHKALLNRAYNESSQCLVILGCNTIGLTTENPLDYVARKQMIEEEYPGVIVTYIVDCESDEEWSTSLDNILNFFIKGKSVTIYGGEDSFLKVYSGEYRGDCITVDTIYSVSATNRRDRISSKIENSNLFRAGVIWGINNSPEYPVVHVVVVMHDKATSSIELFKEEGKEYYQLPSGVLDIYDSVEAIITNLDSNMSDVNTREFLFSTDLVSWPYSYEHCTEIALVFKIDAEEDYCACANSIWLPLSGESDVEIYEPHKSLIRSIKKKLC